MGSWLKERVGRVWLWTGSADLAWSLLGYFGLHPIAMSAAFTAATLTLGMLQSVPFAFLIPTVLITAASVPCLINQW